MRQLHVAARAFGLQHRDDLLRAVVAEELPLVLLVKVDSMPPDEIDEVRRRVARERRACELRVLGEIPLVPSGLDIREVAAAAAGDADLLAEPRCMFDQHDARAALACDGRAHHAGGPGADDGNIEAIRI